jgi:hypothetical protein
MPSAPNISAPVDLRHAVEAAGAAPIAALPASAAEPGSLSRGAAGHHGAMILR